MVQLTYVFYSFPCISKAAQMQILWGGGGCGGGGVHQTLNPHKHHSKSILFKIQHNTNDSEIKIWVKLAQFCDHYLQAKFTIGILQIKLLQ